MEDGVKGVPTPCAHPVGTRIEARDLFAATPARLNFLKTDRAEAQACAETVRRLHDTDRSGWWYLIVLTIIGIIPLIIWFCTRGTIGENRFGPDPLGAEAPDARPENTFVT